jgi:hypothetical protein
VPTAGTSLVAPNAQATMSDADLTERLAYFEAKLEEATREAIAKHPIPEISMRDLRQTPPRPGRSQPKAGWFAPSGTILRA